MCALNPAVKYSIYYICVREKSPQSLTSAEIMNDLPIRPSATSRLPFVKCTQHLSLVSLQIVFVPCRKTYQVTQHIGNFCD